jgi:hypothetical protein
MKFVRELLTMKNLKRIFLFGTLILALVLILGFIGLKLWIKIEANNIASRAMEAYHKDKVESLLLVIDSFEYTFKERNQAIWSLGVLGDDRALARLESLQTHEKCNHNKGLCQYEIKKAILKIKGDYRALWHLNANNYYK